MRSYEPTVGLQQTSACRADAEMSSLIRQVLEVHQEGGMSPTSSAFVANNELALHVPDPSAAESFYTGVLGCEVVSRTPDCIALRSGALRLYLLRDPARTHEAVVPSFDVPDRAAALTVLKAAGCTLELIGPHAPGEHYVRDPHGVLFDVIERSPQGAT